jgi:hypothetical protein
VYEAAQLLVVGSEQRGRTEILVDPGSDEVLQSGGIVAAGRIGSSFEL